jgi:hypothetical protein
MRHSVLCEVPAIFTSLIAVETFISAATDCHADLFSFIEYKSGHGLD